MTLSRENVDDSALNQLFNDLPGRCIILMEDVDVAFVHGVSRSDTEPDAASSLTAKSKLSLSGILNALDGVGAQEGRLLFATTNRIDALDSALCRPGRMDRHIKFQYASQFQAKALFKWFYLPSVIDSFVLPKEVLTSHRSAERLQHPCYARQAAQLSFPVPLSTRRRLNSRSSFRRTSCPRHLC